EVNTNGVVEMLVR
ncbi:hypothetical protein A2U01_0108848, partial [Trifolium medium]|nr:hypothetical protein [Trifolium medium]